MCECCESVEVRSSRDNNNDHCESNKYKARNVSVGGSRGMAAIVVDGDEIDVCNCRICEHEFQFSICGEWNSKSGL